jgi:hypothetical protein
MQTGARIFDRELARVPRPDDIGAMIRARAYHPISRVKPEGKARTAKLRRRDRL